MSIKKDITINSKLKILDIINNLQNEINNIGNNLIVFNIIIESIKVSHTYINTININLNYKIKDRETELKYIYKHLKTIINYEKKKMYKIEREIIKLKQIYKYNFKNKISSTKIFDVTQTYYI